jgi:hypothetical protein
MLDTKKRILGNIPWDLEAFEFGINQWSWVSTCHNANFIKWVYMVIEIISALIVAHEYTMHTPRQSTISS